MKTSYLLRSTLTILSPVLCMLRNVLRCERTKDAKGVDVFKKIHKYKYRSPPLGVSSERFGMQLADTGVASTGFPTLLSQSELGKDTIVSTLVSGAVVCTQIFEPNPNSPLGYVYATPHLHKRVPQSTRRAAIQTCAFKTITFALPGRLRSHHDFLSNTFVSLYGSNCCIKQ